VDSSKEKPGPLVNRLLAALPREEYERLKPNLQLIHLPKNRILYEATDSIRQVYFINKGMTSLFSITEDGQVVDICMVGNEGMLGLPIILSSPITPCRVMTQLPCEALVIKSEHLLAEFNRQVVLNRLLLRYTYVQQVQIIQSAVCHSLHSIRQRFCRWLLVIRDSLQADTFDATQEHIANMLGHQRNRITLTARELLQQGLIEYGGGSMTIIDRVGIEAASCECYQIVKESVNQFL
jgi:CRP-like cAMP-binding protein